MFATHKPIKVQDELANALAMQELTHGGMLLEEPWPFAASVNDKANPKAIRMCIFPRDMKERRKKKKKTQEVYFSVFFYSLKIYCRLRLYPNLQKLHQHVQTRQYATSSGKSQWHYAIVPRARD